MTHNDDSDVKGTVRREPPSFAPPVILDRLLKTMEQPSPAEALPPSKTVPAARNLPPKTKIPPAIAAQRDTVKVTPKPVPPLQPPKTPPPQMVPVSEESNQTLPPPDYKPIPPPEISVGNEAASNVEDYPSNNEPHALPELAPPPPDKELPPSALPDFPAPPRSLQLSPLMVGLILVILLNIVLGFWVILMVRERADRERPIPSQPPGTRITEASAPGAGPDKAIPDKPDVVGQPGPKQPPSRAVEQPSAADALHIRKLVLCRSVSGFGHYEPIPNMPLRPNHFPHIQAYIEIAHPKPEQRKDGRYVYRMTKTMKVYRSDIGPTEPVMDTALSLVVGGYSPRRDFHSAQPLQTSRRIQPGEYILVVSITDQISGETITEDISFLIHGQ